MVRSGFFNSVNGDRKYDSKRFAEYFASFIGNGVFPNPSTGLQVISNNDMTVTVQAGRAWINGYILINDDDYILTLNPADGVLNRIDRIVLRYDTADREIRIEVKQGTFASSPVAPALQRDADAYELGIADIAINKGAISISQANITDLRFNSTYCGIVTGTVNQIDTTNLFAQYEAAFHEWFAELKDILDDNTAANLLNQITGIAGSLEEHKAENMILIPKSGSTANAILLDIELADKKKGSFRASVNNTGNMTINGKPFKKDASTQIPAGGVKAGKVYDFYYDQSANSVFILAKASGNAQPSDVLAGKTFSNDDGEQVGTLPNNGSQTATLTISGSGKPTKTIPPGYTTGGTVTAQVNTNQAVYIKKDYNLGGCVGTLEPLVSPAKIIGTPSLTVYHEEDLIFNLFPCEDNELVTVYEGDSGDAVYEVCFYNYNGMFLRKFNSGIYYRSIHYDKFRQHIIAWNRRNVANIRDVKIYDKNGVLINSLNGYWDDTLYNRCIGATQNRYITSYYKSDRVYLRYYNSAWVLQTSKYYSMTSRQYGIMVGFKDCVVHHVSATTSSDHREFFIYGEDGNIQSYPISLAVILGITD